MIKGDYDRLVELAEFNVCAEHRTQLEVAWSGQERTWFLRCGVCDATEAITRNPSQTEAWRQGAPSPEEYVNQELTKGGKKPVARDKQVIPFEIAGVPGHDLATGELLSKEKMLALVDYARKYGLDPMRGHVCLMYGNPYITIDGYFYHANKSGKPFTLMSHPMTEDEKKDHMISLEDHAWLAIVTFTGTNNAFSGLGIVTRDEMTAKSTKKPGQLRSPVVAAYPWQLAQKRAEWQVLRRAFPIGESDPLERK